MENLSKEYSKELALVTVIIMHNDILNGTVFNTFDRAYAIAEKFVEKFGLDDEQWVETDFEEAVYKFAKEQIA